MNPSIYHKNLELVTQIVLLPCTTKHSILECSFVNKVVTASLLPAFWTASLESATHPYLGWRGRSQSFLQTSGRLVPPTPIMPASQEAMMKPQKYAALSQAFTKGTREVGEAHLPGW